MYDVVIIGAGVTGSAIARELSKTNRKIAVLERAADVCEGTSKANSGIVHAGFDARPGTLMAKLNVEGNALMEQYAKDLDFSFKRNGSLVLCFDEKDRDKLEELKERGIKNGVKELRIIEKDELKAIEPNISDEVVCALLAPTGGIVCPFGLTIALAENAAVNGVEFFLNREVINISKKDDFYQVETNQGNFDAEIVINAAGVYADKIHAMVSKTPLTIIPRKGEYCLMDKKVGNHVSHTIFQLPTIYGKGILITPTVHGNLLVGPTAYDIDDKEGINTSSEGLDEVMKKATLSSDSLPRRQVITSFSGLRAHRPEHEFLIAEAEDAPKFVDVAGIESPGLTSAPALGIYVAEMIQKIKPAEEKKDFIATRKGVPSMALASKEERRRLIEEDPAYANVICRCELVTEGEILNAIRRPLGAKTLDAIKRRTRAGMGRCQAGFCSPKTVEILARELGVDISEITKSGGNSNFIVGYDKEDI